MTYSIQIQGMHCDGCSNLIKMSLEDASFENVIINRNNNAGTFTSDKNLSTIKEILDHIFAEFTGYTYSDLKMQS